MDTIHKALLISLLIISPIYFLSAKVAPPAKNPGIMDSYPAKKIATHSWAVFGPTGLPSPENKGFMNNPVFVITEKNVVVFDPGSSVHVGRALLKQIRKQTDKPISHVFNTHVHGDHWLGNQAFFEANPKIKIYAHPVMIEEAKGGEAEKWIANMEKLTQGISKGTKAVIPSIVLKDGQEIQIDDITIKTHLSKKAHTKTDAMFEIKQDKVLITGDNAFNLRMPRLDDGSYIGSMTELDKMLKLPVDIVVPGHGPAGGKEILTNFRNLLYTIYDTSKTLLDDDMESYEMKPVIVKKLEKYNTWNNFDGAIGKLISLAVLEAENE